MLFESTMSTSTKITDDEMKYFQFKARQMYLLRKEDHEWNEFCKKNICTCCSCQPEAAPKESKDVAVQSLSKKALPSRESNASMSFRPQNRNLPQALNEIKTKLEKIDLALSKMEPTTEEAGISQQSNVLRAPGMSEVPESVKSLINEKKMQIIQNSLKMSLQRLQSSALWNAKPVSTAKVKKKPSGYFIPHELEKQRAVARRMYLASLQKTTSNPGNLLSSSRQTKDSGKGNVKQKLSKTTVKSRVNTKVNSNKREEEETTLVASEGLTETKDENIEHAVDAIVDDLMGETILVINKIKEVKSAKSSTRLKMLEETCAGASKIPVLPLDSEGPRDSAKEKQESQWDKIRHNLVSLRTQFEHRNHDLHSLTKKPLEKVSKDTIYPSGSYSQSTSTIPKRVAVTAVQMKELSVDPKVAKQITKCRKEYWNYLGRISRTKKGNFDPWTLSNLVAESILDDCIHEISEELQDVPTSLVTDLYDQEFLQSI